MALPPRWFGDRGEHAVIVARRGGVWTAAVDGHLLGSGFRTEDAARLAAGEQVLRREGIAHALLRRVRRGLWRKLR